MYDWLTSDWLSCMSSIVKPEKVKSILTLNFLNCKIGSLSRFGPLWLQTKNHFHFNISTKSHIMNLS